MTDPIWINDITVLVKTDRFIEFIPNVDMSNERKHNSFVRLSIYVGLLLWIINKNYLYLYVPIITMALSYILYLNPMNYLNNTTTSETDNQHENANTNNKYADEEDIDFDQIIDKFDNTDDLSNDLSNGRCSKPSPNNPFMNVLPTDSRKRIQACRPYNKSINQDINKHFDSKLYKDVSDIFNNRNSQRQFYTMPSTTIPNEQETFSKWLYLTPPTCKEGNGDQCVANTQERLNGRSYKFV